MTTTPPSLAITEDWVVQVAQRAANEAVKQIVERSPGMRARAGSVVDIGDEATPDAIGDPVVNQALVIPDGADEPLFADSIMTHPVRPGDRVYMLHVPPHAYVIIGRIRVAEEVDDIAPLEGVIVQDTPGTITFIDPDGMVIGRQSTLEWALGEIDPPGHRFTMDHVGGIRFRDTADSLVNTIDEHGVTLRDGQTGAVVAELKGGDTGSLRLVDQAGTDDIELVTSSIGTLPNPKYASTPEANPGTSIIAPASTLFTNTPPDDLDLYHAAAFLAGTSQSATWTPPVGTTERLDVVHNTGDSTLAAAIADRDPATANTGTFLSSQSNWLQGLGSHVVIRGGGAASPSYRSISEASYGPDSATTVTIAHPKPSGVVQTDVLVAFIAMGNAGGSVPTGWTTPEGWEFLGANVVLAGSGASLSCLAVGAWVKLASASEPTDYTISITFGPGSKRLHAAIVAVQNPDLIEGGAHIRMAGHPIRRLLRFNELQAASATLADFQNIPGGYDHLEFIWQGQSDRATDALRNLRMRFNADTGANYHWQTIRDVGAPTQGLGSDRIILGLINGANLGHRTGGRAAIYSYTSPFDRMVITEAMGVEAGNLFAETNRAFWLNTTDPITRIQFQVDGGTTLFDAGGQAFLYGY
jgi:hypothetical protein